MTLGTSTQPLASGDIGEKMHRLASELYPICRSITGDGVRQTLELLKGCISLQVHEVATSTKVFDWAVPKEWNIRDAYIKDASGKRIVDFRESNLHVMGYSVPVKKKLKLRELKEHLFTLPDQPDWIPYRTSYYNENWGFCLHHRQLLELKDEEYEVCIDSSLRDGHLTYGEYYLRGQTDDEVLVSTHVCHPSLCNDNLSGIVVAAHLAQHLQNISRRYSYRFVFVPGMIGPITWLCRNEKILARIKHGFVLTGVGDGGNLTYKRSRKGEAEIDRAVIQVLKQSGADYKVIDFSPWGYDERQYCSPGIDLPVGVLMRSKHGEYPEYHTSADNLDFIKPAALADSLEKCLAVVDVLEHNCRFVNLNPKCEPQLGKRGLYGSIGGQAQVAVSQLALLWVLNLSDGKHSLLDIADRSGLSFAEIKNAAHRLSQTDLLTEAAEDACRFEPRKQAAG